MLCVGGWYVHVCTCSKAEDRIGNQANCNIFYYLVLFCVLSFGEAEV